MAESWGAVGELSELNSEDLVHYNRPWAQAIERFLGPFFIIWQT